MTERGGLQMHGRWVMEYVVWFTILGSLKAAHMILLIYSLPPRCTTLMVHAAQSWNIDGQYTVDTGVFVLCLLDRGNSNDQAIR